jgi:hypothetical protein
MPLISTQTKQDRLLPVVAEVVAEILESASVVTALDVLVRLEAIDPEQVDRWRKGQLPYLERGITAGLSRVARLLQLLRDHALSLGLTPVPGKYTRKSSGPKRRLRFSKRGDAESEQAYSTHFVRANSDAVPAPVEPDEPGGG